MFWCVLHTLFYGTNNKFVSDFIMMVQSSCIMLFIHTPGISFFIVSLLWLWWLDIIVSLGIYWLLYTRVLVNLMVPMLIFRSFSTFIPRCSRESLYYFYPMVMSWFPVLCALLCYMYFVVMVRVLLCSSCKTLLLLFHGNGADLPLCTLHNSATFILRCWRVCSCASSTSPTVLITHLCCACAQWKLLPTVILSIGVQSSLLSWYHFLMVHGSYFFNLIESPCYFNRCLYLVVTLCRFF